MDKLKPLVLNRTVGTITIPIQVYESKDVDSVVESYKTIINLMGNAVEHSKRWASTLEQMYILKDVAYWNLRIQLANYKLDEFIRDLDIDIEDIRKFGTKKQIRMYDGLNRAVSVCTNKLKELQAAYAREQTDNG